jgi:uncharacterized protein YjfI (DUF2170 family)
MEDIDAYINKLKGEQEMKDYIDKGIYPESLISEYTSIFDFQMIQDGLTTVENEIRNVMEREIVEIVENKENECPICMNDMGVNNYLVPACGHTVCMNCFIKNIRQNKHQGHLCCLCRMNIVPDL